MRFTALSVLAFALVGNAFGAGRRAACPTGVLDATTRILDTKTGVELTVTSPEPARTAEIRRRAHDLVEVTSGRLPDVDLEFCEAVVTHTKIVALDIDGGARVVVTAKASDVKSIQDETHRRRKIVLDGLAAPHARLLVDTKTQAEVWIDGIDSGYRTPTDAIILPPGAHQVSVRDDAGHLSAPDAIVLAQDETRRLYFPLNESARPPKK
jgi:hypothetical protein